MHVGLIVYGDLNRQSGGYLYDRKLVEHLRASGDEVTVFSQPDRPYPLHVVDNFDVAFWQRVAKSGVDVLLQDELNHLSLVLGNWWLRSTLDAPIVSIVHHLRASESHPPVLKRTYREIERAYLHTLDAFVFNSLSTRRSVEALVPQRDHVIAPPSGRRFGAPVNESCVRSRAKEGPLRVLFVGNVIPRKRLHVLIEALVQTDVDVELDVAGDLATAPGYTTRVRDDVNANGLADRVRLHGSVPDDELQRLFREAHLLAVPSSYEGYGIVYVEAMGHGLPVIATPNGGPVDVVDDGTTGFLVTPPLASSIANILNQLHADRRHLAEMSVAALRHYNTTPTWKETAKNIRQFLSQIIQA